MNDPGALSAELQVTLGELMRTLRRQGTFEDLTRTQLNVLARLEGLGEATQSELARVVGIRPQSMAAVVSALEGEGHIVRRPHPSDGRKSMLSISAATQEQFDSKRLAREDWLTEAIRAELDEAEKTTIQAALPLLKRLAERP